MSLHEIKASTIQGDERSLKDYEGNLVMVVNVASKCGLTPQYKDLEELYRKYKDRGFRILGFPCNQFMGQEPGSEEEIQQFCSTKYDVTFDLFSKVDVNGQNRHPVYQFLAGENAAFPGDISWNFEKFLVDGQGKVLQRFSPKTSPSDASVIKSIEENLG
ncbi:MAG TPA: glutathione peroxidase [Leptospiraceae bacterium]|nr:glutathione peroxidase [Spirochaetaceae bacterium]HBS04506.1 glutathione peroxidase [Leptospiraceae bacterium]|tara:strand:- start:3122 stop:3601 length:480 start_codon:yes stop_codon:yes gene_type:complete